MMELRLGGIEQVLSRVRQNRKERGKEMLFTTLHIVNDKDVPFNVRLLREGEKYGRTWSLTHQGEPILEFYSATEKNIEKFHETLGLGYFISRYYISTLSENKCGIALFGNNRDWELEYETLQEILEWANEQLRG